MPLESDDVSKQYSKWWRGLKSSERKALIASGYFDPQKPHNAEPLDIRSKLNDTPISFLPRDLEWHSDRFKLQLSSPSTYEEVCDNETKRVDDKQRQLVSDRLQALFFFIIKRMDESSDCSMRLDADVLRIVIGADNPPSQTKLAKRYGVTKQAVSIRCRTLLRQLGIETSLFMRPEDEVNSMRVSRILRHYSASATPPKESFDVGYKKPTRLRPRKK